MCFQKLGRASKKKKSALNPVGIVRGPLPPRAPRHFTKRCPSPSQCLPVLHLKLVVAISMHVTNSTQYSNIFQVHSYSASTLGRPSTRSTQNKQCLLQEQDGPICNCLMPLIKVSPWMLPARKTMSFQWTAVSWGLPRKKSYARIAGGSRYQPSNASGEMDCRMVL